MIKLNEETRKALVRMTEETQVYPEGNFLKLLDPEDDADFTNYIARSLERDRSMRQRRLEITKQIQIQNRELTASNEKISLLNNELIIALEEQKRAKDQLTIANKILEKKNKDLEQFSWMTSHNLRGPLASTMGVINLFESFVKSNADMMALYEHLRNSAAKMNDILADVSMLLETKNAQVILNEAFLLDDLLDELKDKLRQVAGIPPEIYTSDFSNCPGVVTTKKVLSDVLFHLMCNSFQYRYNEREPIVAITAEVLDDQVVIRVTDNGCGIREEDFEAIFEPFKKLNYSSTGKGLGLYLAMTQAEAIGGTLSVSSKLEIGSVFTLTLPIIAQ